MFKLMVFLLLFSTLSLTYAAPSTDDVFPLLVPGGGIGGIFKGPNKETIIQGPDGSVITAENEPGLIVQSDDLREEKPIVVADVPEQPIETISTIVQPIKTIAQPVENIATASVAPAINYQPQILEDTNNLVAPLQEEVILDDGALSSEEFISNGAILEPRIRSENVILQEQPLLAPRKILRPQKYLVTPKLSSPTLSPQPIALSSTPAPPVLSSTLAPAILSSSWAPSVLSSTPRPRILSSTLSSHVLGSTLAPEQLQGVSSTATYLNLVDSDRIDLGNGNIRTVIPVVEYASSNGFVNNARAEILGVTVQPIRNNDLANLDVQPIDLNLVSSTARPIETAMIEDSNIYSTNIPPITSGFGTQQTPLLYKRSTLQKRQMYNQQMPRSYTNMHKSNIQRIPKFSREKFVRIDGKIDMGKEYRTNRDLYDRYSDTVQLPPTLRRQLAEYLPRARKYGEHNDRKVAIDGKMGDMNDNEIPQQSFYGAPSLSETKWFAPPRADRNMYESFPLSFSETSRLAPQGMFTMEDRIEADLWNRYGRDTKKSRK